MKNGTPISNQLQTNSCVGNATCDMFEILMYQDKKEVIQLSRAFVYYNARNIGGTSNLDQGCQIPNAFKSLETLGVCEESLWEFKEDNMFLQPSILAYKQARDNKIRQTSRIVSSGNDRLLDLTSCLDVNHPIVFGAAVSKGFCEDDGTLTYDTPSVSVGNHCMIITGYRKNPGLEFLVRNSWSSSWGGNNGAPAGHCWMSANYITSTSTYDFWIGTMLNDFFID